MPDSDNSPVEKAPDWSILKILNWTQSYFESHDIDSPRLTAEILLAYSLDIKRLDLYLQYDRPLEKGELSQFKRLIKRRVQKNPVAYITGCKGFFESDFDVTPDVLIPRPDTETLVERALTELVSDGDNPSPKRVLELGTGSGAIIVSVAQKAPVHSYFASDVSPAATAVAFRNARKLTQTAIRFCSGSWFDMLGQNAVFDMIVSNPPYIPARHIELLQDEVRREPRLALDGGPDGLDCYRVILAGACDHLVEGGVLLLEIGYDQRPGIERLIQQFSSYQPPEFIKDLAGHNRVVVLKKHH